MRTMLAVGIFQQEAQEIDEIIVATITREETAWTWTPMRKAHDTQKMLQETQ